MQRLKRSIGLTGAVFILVGYVIGASIFILPGSLASTVGPGTFVVFLLAGIPAVFTCFIMAQVGSCFPRSGAIFILLREVLHPSIAFLYIWIMVIMAGVVIPLVAYGFVEYLGHFYEVPNKKVGALIIVGLFILINTSGMKLANRAQTVMAVIFLISLLIFGVAGFYSPVEVTNEVLFPNGIAVVGISVVTAYFSYTGFFVIAEIAGEVKNPTRNIPLAVLISFIVIIIIYALVPFTLTHVLDWQRVSQNSIPVVAAANQFLPPSLVDFVAVGALLAAATSINGVLMGISRDVYKSARSRYFHPYFDTISQESGCPTRAVILSGTIAVIGTLIGNSVVGFAQLAVMGLVVIQVSTGIALLMYAKKYPEQFNELEFKLAPWLLKFVCYGYIIFSLIFLWILASENFYSLLWGAAYLMIGFVLFKVFAKEVA